MGGILPAKTARIEAVKRRKSTTGGERTGIEREGLLGGERGNSECQMCNSSGEASVYLNYKKLEGRQKSARTQKCSVANVKVRTVLAQPERMTHLKLHHDKKTTYY